MKALVKRRRRKDPEITPPCFGFGESPWHCYSHHMPETLKEENVFEDIEKLSRFWANPERGTDQNISLAEVVESLSKLHANLTAFRRRVLTLYDAAELLTSRAMSTVTAATAWEGLHNDYAAVLNRFMHLPKITPETDAIIDDLRNVLRNLEAKSNQEYRSYKEAAHLVSSPANARELQESIKEAREGKLEPFSTAEDFKRSLRTRK